YLDDRMDGWLAGPDKRQTGQVRTSCLSCHTALPYALARPALRKAMGVEARTSQETQVLDETARRVESYSTHQLLSDFNEAKKRESRGTEAVLNGLILALEDARRRQPPGPATAKAFERLWQDQAEDGAWNWLDFGLEPWESRDARYLGAALAAIAAGAAP